MLQNQQNVLAPGGYNSQSDKCLSRRECTYDGASSKLSAPERGGKKNKTKKKREALTGNALGVYSVLAALCEHSLV